jgi:phage gp45-like
MHRATPIQTSFRSYVGGGARSVISGVDDSKLMQEMAGNFMKGETRQKVESPQNYGFTSVVMDADKGQDGQISGGAEGFITFCGGNRSFPVCSVMDDRRHRLQNLQKGDVAMFRTRSDQQQFHLTQDGGYWTAPDNKTARMQLVPAQQQQSGSGSGGSGSARDTSGGSGGTSGASGQQQKGQQPIYKDGQNSVQFVDLTKDKSRLSGNEAHLMLSDGDSYVHCIGQETYLGGRKDKHSFAKVCVFTGGACVPSANVYARISSLAEAEADEMPWSSLPWPTGALILALGVSIGINYALITDAFHAFVMLASR